MPILGCLKNRRETLISERFHLGGVAYLRGFQYKGLGDRAARREASDTPAGDPQAAAALTSDALGGDVYARVRAAVRFPVCWPLHLSLSRKVGRPQLRSG